MISPCTHHGRRKLFLPILTIALCQCASAADYYVAPNGVRTKNTGPAPFSTIQAALDKAKSGDTIWVDDGTYGPEGANTCGDTCDINNSPVLINKAGAEGAYITIRAINRGKAVLNCHPDTAGAWCDSYFNLSIGAAYIEIDDFVITGGYWDAIHSNDNAHHIRIAGNDIYNIGHATSSNIGITGMYTNPACHDFVIDRNVFHDIGRGAGTTSLDHGLYLHGTSFTVTNNIFYNLVNGWGIQAADGLKQVLIANNTFANQNPGQEGQIMLWNSQSNITIRNNIFYHPSNNGIARYQSRLRSCAIDHNLVYGPGAGVMANTNGCSVGANSTALDPLFVDPSNLNFHLSVASPAINAGVDLSTVPAIDFDGQPRSQGGSMDAGAFEYPLAGAAPTIIAGPTVSGVTTNSATITWTTLNPTMSLVEYGTDTNYTSATPSLEGTAPAVNLSNLSRGTVYHFRVRSWDSKTGFPVISGDFTFQTARR